MSTSLHVDSISNYFYAKISDKTIRDAKKIGIARLIADNTNITDLTIENIPNHKKIDLLFEGLKHNTTLKYLHLKGLGTGRVPFPNCGVIQLTLNYLHLQDLTIFSSTTLKSLNIIDLLYWNNYYVKYCRLLKTLKVKTLSIKTCPRDMPSIICSSIFANDNIKHLDINTDILEGSSLSDFKERIDSLQWNTTLEVLTISRHINDISKYIHFKECIRSNKSLLSVDINCARWLAVDIDEILLRNKNLRWNCVYPEIVNITITMASITLQNFRDDMIPPYVMLWIINWIYEDNPYSTHLKKINLIMGLYNSIRKIPRYSVV